MKRGLNYLLFILIVSGLWSCKSFEGTTVSVTPDPLEVHGDSIEFTAKVDVPPQPGLKKDITYIARPELGDYKEFEEIRVKTTDFPNAATEGIQASITRKAPFHKDDMMNNYLEVEHGYIKGNGKEKELPDIDDLATCCITTSQLYMLNADFMFSEVQLPDPTPLKIVAQFNFPLDVWQLQSDDLNNAQINQIQSFLDKKQVANAITIHGYASPEGPLSRNKFLADKRSEVVKQWMQKQLKAAGYKEYAKSSAFNMNATDEDWQGFEQKVRNSGLSEEKKKALIDIANSNVSAQQKEEMLYDVVNGGIHEVHNEMENLLAPLRRTTVVIEGPAQGLTLRQIDSIAALYTNKQLDGEALRTIYTKEQYLTAAQRTYARTGDKSLLVAYYQAYPQDYMILNDMALLALVDPVKLQEVQTTMKVEDDGFKIEKEGAGVEIKIKVDGDDMKIERENESGDENEVKIKSEGDEAKLKTDNLKIKADGDEFKIKDDKRDIKIKQDGDELKIKDDERDIKIKVEDGEMKVKTPDNVYKYEGVNPDAVAMMYSNEYNEALKNLQQAYNLNPNDYIVLSNLGAVTVTKRNYVDAEKYLVKSLQTKETPQANYNLALVYAMKGQYEKAMTHFNKAGNNPKIMYNRGLTKLLMENYTGAQQDLNTYIAAYPDEPYAYYLLAIVGARTNNVDMLVNNIQKACNMDKKLCDKADEDLEFREYEENERFEDAIND